MQQYIFNKTDFLPVASFWRNIIQIFDIAIKALAILMLVFLLSGAAHAHRGVHAESNEFDVCRLRVGYEWIHFAASTPTLTGGVTYCEAIPGLGPTNLVFDYEGKKLRNVTIEFEVTKEPEGTRVFYQEPKKIKTGTVNGLVDFSQYGAGNYLAHVTIVHEGKKLDQHLAFTAGLGSGFELGLISTILIILCAIVGIYFAVRTYNKGKDEQLVRQEFNQE